MKFIVRTSSVKFSRDPEGFRSSDRCAAVLKAFCHAHGFPYEDIFVCIAIKVEKVSPLRPAGVRTVYSLSQEFGKYAIELVNDVVSDIQVVAAGDFQTVICHAIHLQCSSTDDRLWRKYIKENIFDLRGLNAEQKRRKLEKAAGRLPSSRYAEARVLRTLHTGDKKVPNSD